MKEIFISLVHINIVVLGQDELDDNNIEEYNAYNNIECIGIVKGWTLVPMIHV